MKNQFEPSVPPAKKPKADDPMAQLEEIRAQALGGRVANSVENSSIESAEGAENKADDAPESTERGETPLSPEQKIRKDLAKMVIEKQEKADAFIKEKEGMVGVITEGRSTYRPLAEVKADKEKFVVENVLDDLVNKSSLGQLLEDGIVTPDEVVLTMTEEGESSRVLVMIATASEDVLSKLRESKYFESMLKAKGEYIGQLFQRGFHARERTEAYAACMLAAFYKADNKGHGAIGSVFRANQDKMFDAVDDIKEKMKDPKTAENIFFGDNETSELMLRAPDAWFRREDLIQSMTEAARYYSADKNTSMVRNCTKVIVELNAKGLLTAEEANQILGVDVFKQ